MKKKDYRICEFHEMEETESKVKITHNGKDVILTYKMTIPKGTDVQNKLRTKKRKDQTALEFIQIIRENIDSLSITKNYGIDKDIPKH